MLELIADLEVASRQDLENGVAIVLKEELVVVCFVLGFYVSEPLSSQKAFDLTLCFKPLDSDPLSKLKELIFLVL